MNNIFKQLAAGITAAVAFNAAQANDNTTDDIRSVYKAPPPHVQSELQERINNSCSGYLSYFPKNVRIDDITSATPAERRAILDDLEQKDRRYMICAIHATDVFRDQTNLQHPPSNAKETMKALEAKLQRAMETGQPLDLLPKNNAP